MFGRKKRRITLARRWLSLPNRQREMYFLCDVLKLSETEAANLMGISRGAVAAHRRRAHEIMKPLGDRDCPLGAHGLELYSVVTTVIAIYGAVLSTVSALLGAWYFLRSGPRLQAEAIAVSQSLTTRFENWTIQLRVWNAGRADITIDLHSLILEFDGLPIVLSRDDSAFAYGDMRSGIHGPAVPIRIPGHSGESWRIDRLDLQFTASAKLSVMLEVGGKRGVKVPVLDPLYIKKRRFILPGSPQPE
jgi:sigma-70-like protein